jgi:hypothetical protein
VFKLEVRKYLRRLSISDESYVMPAIEKNKKLSYDLSKG